MENFFRKTIGAMIRPVKGIFVDRRFRICRIWSNGELKKFARLFRGEIINVSSWQDKDKEGSFYKNYFTNASKYYLSNYKKDCHGLQRYENEIFLDLESELAENLVNKFDVVFNHTTLEHIYNFKTAFKNLCLMTKDVVILTVPFVQEMHACAEYDDYWRFTPLAIKRMFKEQNMAVFYSSSSNYKMASKYLFFMASKNPAKWKDAGFSSQE